MEIDHLHLPNTPEKRYLIKSFWKLERQKVGYRKLIKHAQTTQSSRLSRSSLPRSDHRLLVYFLFLDAFPLKFIFFQISAQSKISSFFGPDFMASVSISQLRVVLLYSDWRRVFWRENWISKKPKTMKLWQFSLGDGLRFWSSHDLECLQTPTLFAVSLSLAEYQTVFTYFSRRLCGSFYLQKMVYQAQAVILKAEVGTVVGQLATNMMWWEPTHEPLASVWMIFWPHFDVFCEM